VHQFFSGPAVPGGSGPRQQPGRSPVAVGGGLQVGQLFGAPIIVAPSWLLFLAWITWQFAPVVENSVPGIGTARYAVSASFGISLGLSVLAHEVAHAATARAFGIPLDRIVLTAIAGHSALGREPETPRRMFLVAGAGPVANLVIAAGAWAGFRTLPHATVGSVLAAGLALTNGVVGIYNLLPGLPLDGGQMLRSVVWAVSHNPRTGVIAGAWAGRLLGAATAVAGLYLLSRPDSGLQGDGIWALLIAGVMLIASSAVLRQQALRDRLPRLSVRDLTRRALPVAGDLPLAEAVRRAQESHARGLVIVDGRGQPTAVVNEAAVMATPEARRPWVSVSSVSRSVSVDDLLPVWLTGEDLLRRLQTAPAPEYIVIQPDGEVYGVLATSDVAAALQA
jgi:Zn-dependent protease